MRDHITLARAFGVENGVDIEDVLPRYAAAAERIRPLVCDTAYLLRGAMNSGRNLLFEGAQGTMLDIDHGTYPFVTSSSAGAGGRLYRRRSSTDGDRRCNWYLQDLYHSCWRRTVPH